MKKKKTTARYLIENILGINDFDLSSYDDSKIEYYSVEESKMNSIIDKIDNRHLDVTYVKNNQGKVFSNVNENIYAFKIIIL